MLSAVDPAARALGLLPGMTVTHARSLVPDLAIAQADPAGDTAGLARLGVWCLRYAPVVAADPPGGLWIDVSGAAHLHGGEAAMLAGLVARLAGAGFAARAAVADTPGAAYAVARYGGDASLTVVVPPGSSAALDGLPVEALRLAPGTADGLRRLGFERVASLRAAPRAPLQLRFGAEPGLRLDQALGAVFEPIEPILPPSIPRRRRAFAEPLGEAEALQRAIGDLVALLMTDLEALVLGVRRLDLLYRGVDGRVQATRIGTACASRDAPRLAGLLAERLEGIDPGFGIEAMTLSAPITEPLEHRQLRAAGPKTGEGAREVDLAPLVDALVNRLGAGRVYRAAPIESDMPERTVRRIQPLAPASGATWPPCLPRPARLLDPPERVEAVAMLPDHPPALFVWRGVRRRVRAADGPERVFGEWWRSAGEVGEARDYYRAEDEEGQRYWLYRAGPANEARWFMHGLFG